MRGTLARKKKVPAWLKQRDYLNAKLGREELVDRLHVRAFVCLRGACVSSDGLDP